MTDRFSALPPELILNIIAYLYTQDQVCLALTSKAFSNIQGSDPWIALASAKRAEGYKKDRQKTEWAILERLESDFPDQHLCVWERKLRRHTRRPPPRQNQVNDPPRGWNRCRVRSKTQITATTPANARTWLWPSFCEVRMLMNRHRLGPPHGLPPAHLDLSTPWQANRSWRTYLNKRHPVVDATNMRNVVWYSKLDVKTSIVNNELQLHRSERCLIPSTETAFLIKHRDEIILDYNFEQVSPCLEMPGCIHQDSALRKIRASNIIELLKWASRPGFESRGPHGYINCLNCGSRVQFKVFNHDDARAYEVVIDVWQNLGDGRYVDDGNGWTACYAHGNTVTKPLMEFTTQSMVDQGLLQRATMLFKEVDSSDRLSDTKLPRARRANSMDNMRHGLAEDLLRRKTAYDSVWNQAASYSNGFDLGLKDASQLLDISRCEDDVGIYYMGVPHRRASITGIAAERFLV